MMKDRTELRRDRHKRHHRQDVRMSSPGCDYVDNDNGRSSKKKSHHREKRVSRSLLRQRGGGSNSPEDESGRTETRRRKHHHHHHHHHHRHRHHITKHSLQPLELSPVVRIKREPLSEEEDRGTNDYSGARSNTIREEPSDTDHHRERSRWENGEGSPHQSESREQRRREGSGERLLKAMKGESRPDHVWGKKNGTTEEEKKPPAENKAKPDFGLSGKLAEETNMFNGVVIKYSEPPEARKPKRRWRFYPFKGDEDLPTLYIHRQSAYLIGRDRKVADIPVDHPSCSKQHAALQYRISSYSKEDGTKGQRVRPYIIDLESANGTYINNVKIEPRKYVELFEKDVIKFAYSSREYVLLHEHSKDDGDDDNVME